MRGPFWPVVLNIVAWSLATFNLVLAIYFWRHGHSALSNPGPHPSIPASSPGGEQE